MAPRARLALLLLLLITAASYARVPGFGFVHYDDPLYVFQNPQVRAGLSADGIRWAFTTGHASNWHPLTWLSHMTDVALFGPDRAGAFHAVNVGFHLANVLLVFLVLRRMTGATWRSLLVAAVFALHPLRVESVAWISERKDLLSAFWWLVSMLAYERWARGRRPVAYAAVLGALALALMAKPMPVTAPFLFLVLDHWPLDRLRGRWKARVVEKLPMLALGVASAVVTYRVQEAWGSVATFPLAHRAITAIMATALYPWRFLAPVDLAPLYPNHEGMWPWAAVVVAAAALVGVTVLVFRFRRHPALLTGWLWYVGTLVPVSGLVQVGRQWMADRYTYIPMIGFGLALVWGAALLVERRPRWRGPAVALAGVALAVWIPLTVQQTGIWRDSVTLFEAGLARTTRNDVLENNYGAALLDLGRPEDAIRHFRNAVAIRPEDPTAQGNLGGTLLDLRRWTEAVPALEAAVRLRPGDPEARVRLGRALRGAGRLEEAVQQYRVVLRQFPDHTPAWNNLGGTLGAMRRFPEAIDALRRAIRLDPGNAIAHQNLGLALDATGDVATSRVHLERALQLDPDLDLARRLLERRGG